jgi:hypothetical protein
MRVPLASGGRRRGVKVAAGPRRRHSHMMRLRIRDYASHLSPPGYGRRHEMLPARRYRPTGTIVTLSTRRRRGLFSPARLRHFAMAACPPKSRSCFASLLSRIFYKIPQRSVTLISLTALRRNT